MDGLVKAGIPPNMMAAFIAAADCENAARAGSSGKGANYFNYLGGAVRNDFISNRYGVGLVRKRLRLNPKMTTWFKKAVKMSEGKLTSPYLSLATSVSIKEQNVEEFKSLLNKVLEIDPDLDKNNRLLNTLNIRKARWYLEHIDDFFILEDEDNYNQDETNPVE